MVLTKSDTEVTVPIPVESDDTLLPRITIGASPFRVQKELVNARGG